MHLTVRFSVTSVTCHYLHVVCGWLSGHYLHGNEKFKNGLSSFALITVIKIVCARLQSLIFLNIIRHFMFPYFVGRYVFPMLCTCLLLALASRCISSEFSHYFRIIV